MKKIIVFGIILLFVGTCVLPNVSGIIIEKKHELNEIIRFQVYEFKDGKCKKIIKEMSMKKAFELKERMDIISKGQESLHDEIEMKISLLKDYDLIPKDVTVEKILLENKGINTEITERICNSKLNTYIQEPENLNVHRNFIGTIDFETTPDLVGFTVVFGTHSLIPGLGIDLGLISIGDFHVKTTGLLGRDNTYHCKLGFVLGFAGFLIMGLVGLYLPFVYGLGAYMYTSWIK